MLHKKAIAILVLLLIAAIGVWSVAANSLHDQKAVLAGTVLADGLTTVGTTVREGDSLLQVQTIAGSAPAVRATADGIVREVLVRPGDVVKTGEVVIRLEVRN